MSNDKKEPSDEEIKQLLPIRILSTVVRGFGRGSSDLGIPTANLCPKSAKILGKISSFDELPCGIYWGFCRIGAAAAAAAEDASSSPVGTTYTTAVSIGYNPTYGNESKTVEPHLIAPTEDPRRHKSSCGETVLQDFYDQPARLSVVGYLRPELPFEGLEKLIEAIKNDIVNAEKLASTGEDATTVEEKEWIESDKAE